MSDTTVQPLEEMTPLSPFPGGGGFLNIIQIYHLHILIFNEKCT